jgi:hypothetical protein
MSRHCSLLRWTRRVRVNGNYGPFHLKLSVCNRDIQTVAFLLRTRPTQGTPTCWLGYRPPMKDFNKYRIKNRKASVQCNVLAVAPRCVRAVPPHTSVLTRSCDRALPTVSSYRVPRFISVQTWARHYNLRRNYPSPHSLCTSQKNSVLRDGTLRILV